MKKKGPAFLVKGALTPLLGIYSVYYHPGGVKPSAQCHLIVIITLCLAGFGREPEVERPTGPDEVDSWGVRPPGGLWGGPHPDDRKV